MNLGVSQTIAGIILDIPYCRIDLPVDPCCDPLDTGRRHIGILRKNLCRFLCESIQFLRVEPFQVGQVVQLPFGTEAGTPERFGDVLIVPECVQ